MKAGGFVAPLLNCSPQGGPRGTDGDIIKEGLVTPPTVPLIREGRKGNLPLFWRAWRVYIYADGWGSGDSCLIALRKEEEVVGGVGNDLPLPLASVRCLRAPQCPVELVDIRSDFLTAALACLGDKGGCVWAFRGPTSSDVAHLGD